MTSFTTRTAGLSDLPPDPTKHVNFSLGMVLGVDDLKQEFAYLSGRDQWLARDLLGYGTAVGLGVTADYAGEAQGAVEVVVTPGTAVSPRGQLIRVGAMQCAEVNGWLARAENRAQADTRLGSASSGTLTLYVVLSYRACTTDAVPIPGEPCRSEEESMAASRLADNYRLELTFKAPDQSEEKALRDFVRWLEQVRITNEPGGDGFVSLKNFEQAVRLAKGGGAPPPMRVQTANACQYLRAAFRIWATELRPAGLLGAGASAGVPPTEESVLLAELGVPVVRASGGGWLVAARASRQIEVREDGRPYLLHLRMVQEWIECGRRVRSPGDSVMTEVSFGQSPAPGVSESYSRSDHTHGTPQLEGDVVAQGSRTFLQSIQNVPVEYDRERAADGQVLTYFVPEGEQSEVVFAETDSEKLDLRDVPMRWRPADLTLQGGRVARAADAGFPEDGQVLTFVQSAEGGEWRGVRVSGTTTQSTLDGDVKGATNTTRVERIFGSPIAPRTPTTPFNNGDVLVFSNNRWVPQTPPAGQTTLPELFGDVSGQIQNNRLNSIKGFPVLARFGEEVPSALPGGNSYADGDVLTFRGGSWVPESKDGGPVPIESFGGAQQPPYNIVAAGIVSEGRSRGPVYSGLNLRVVGAGVVTVGFTGYRVPDETFQYIVKALPVFNAELKMGAVVVMFDSFLRSDDLGFRLRVMNEGVPMDAEQLKLLELMIEVSRFAAAARPEDETTK